MSNDIPRRNDITRNTETELAIRHAMRCIEMDAASPHLTQAVALLEKARHAVADFVDGVPVPAEPPSSDEGAGTERVLVVLTDLVDAIEHADLGDIKDPTLDTWDLVNLREKLAAANKLLGRPL